jgi:hypothetical protein
MIATSQICRAFEVRDLAALESQQMMARHTAWTTCRACSDPLRDSVTSGTGLVHHRHVSEQQAVFIFENSNPPVVDIYEDLEQARGSFESMDVPSVSEAFLETGQVVTVVPSDDIFATFHPTERFELERLQSLLRRVAGPTHLADDPSAYAREWLRTDDLDSRRPPFIPRWLYDRYMRARSHSGENQA